MFRPEFRPGGRGSRGRAETPLPGRFPRPGRFLFLCGFDQRGGDFQPRAEFSLPLRTPSWTSSPQLWITKQPCVTICYARLCKAEGMGFEPTTPCGASDFETGCKPPVFSGETSISGRVGAELGAVKPETVQPADPDLAMILERWTALPAAVRSGIVAMVKATAGG